MVAVKEKKQTDYWEEPDMVFVTGGLRWGVSTSGATVCMGPVAGQDTPQPAQNGQEPVLQHDIKGNLPATQDTGVVLQQKHAGGRPIKVGNVHRSTVYRRHQKEKQLEMNIK